MKVAIITLTGDNNYGNKLQNFAVQWNVEQLGHEAVSIRISKFQRRNIKNMIALLLLPFAGCFGSKKKKILRVAAFHRFNKYIKQRYPDINPKDEQLIKKTLASYDKILYGSDQIWNPEFKSFDKVYLGCHASAEKNIALCASFGISQLPEKDISLFSTGLNNFSDISVREETGKAIVENVSSRKAEVLLDPTLAVPVDVWTKMEKPVAVPKKYILKYFLGSEPEIVLNDSDYPNSHFVSANLSSEYGPSEFLYLIHNAQLVCTDSFHASVFSILYETPFRVYERSSKHTSMNSRIDTLFNKLAISYEQMDGYRQVSADCFRDNGLNAKLQEEKKKFIIFLKKIEDS